MDAQVIVWDLLEAGIIDEGDQRTITATRNPPEQNKILHRCLKKKCTLKALRSVCAITMAVNGNPKMKALGDEMMEMLKTEISMCVCVLECVVCVRVCVFASVHL